MSVADPNRFLRSVAGLVAAGLTPPDQVDALRAVAQKYAISLSPTIQAQILEEGGDGPISRQYLPQPAELRIAPEERADPIGDFAHSPAPGLVHRYPDRVLLKALHACPVYCRFCFRREQVGPTGEVLDPNALDAAFAWIEQHPQIWEVILTGGDPFALHPERLAEIVRRLSDISHVDVIRIHTRVPVADPPRLKPALLEALRTQKALWIVVHVNSHRELGPSALGALRSLIDSGIPVLSQSVLLKGVNDQPELLEQLFRALVRARVKPYYLHQGDLAPGTSHLRVPLEEGQRLVDDLRGKISGLCQPNYVLDIPGGAGKVPAGKSWVEADGSAWRVRDPQGGHHRYPPDPT
jgi:lysine 2,3-aminomutase